MLDHVDRKELAVKVYLPHTRTTLASRRLKLWDNLSKLAKLKELRIYKSVNRVRGVAEKKWLSRIDGDREWVAMLTELGADKSGLARTQSVNGTKQGKCRKRHS